MGRPPNIRCSARVRCAVEDTGRNSVRPWIRPRRMAWSGFIRSPAQRDSVPEPSGFPGKCPQEGQVLAVFLPAPNHGQGTPDQHQVNEDEQADAGDIAEKSPPSLQGRCRGAEAEKEEGDEPEDALADQDGIGPRL